MTCSKLKSALKIVHQNRKCWKIYNWIKVNYIGFLSVVWLTILTGKNCVFYSVQYNNGCLAASDLFHMFTQSVIFYPFHCHVLTSIIALRLRDRLFLCDNQWKFSTISILYLCNIFSGKRKPFSKNWSTIF